jgi:hypothetical protein
VWPRHWAYGWKSISSLLETAEGHSKADCYAVFVLVLASGTPWWLGKWTGTCRRGPHGHRFETELMGQGQYATSHWPATQVKCAHPIPPSRPQNPEGKSAIHRTRLNRMHVRQRHVPRTAPSLAPHLPVADAKTCRWTARAHEPTNEPPRAPGPFDPKLMALATPRDEAASYSALGRSVPSDPRRSCR